MILDDTIVAISSAAGASPRMVVRASGPAAGELLNNLCPEGAPHAWPAGVARRCTIVLSPEIGFAAWVWWFAAPRSYTGQDVMELHVPGNPLLARMVLDRLVALGARPAEAGEFTARAYFNGKLDLTQAEGVAASIAANSAAELAAARQLAVGELSRRLRPILNDVAQTLSLVELGIDFSEEDIQLLSAQQIEQRLGAAEAQLADLLQQSSRFEKLSHEPTVVLAGRANAGKSTLTNVLAGRNRSIVSNVAGTTRDALSTEVALARGIVRLVDVAGLENTAGHDPSGIARQMHEQAWRQMQEADALVLVREIDDRRSPPQLPRDVDLVVHSKADLRAPSFPSPGTPGEGQGGGLPISALTGLNMQELRDELDRLAFGTESVGASLALGARHLRGIEEAQAALREAHQHVEDSAELLAVDLRETLDALGQILGQVTPDDILTRIFSTFCIGK
ncbi:MAG: tRNA modification GTPase [Tepidisphaeraceae bacterium]